MNPKLVIFDCDGVLVDTESIAAEVLSTSLAKLGLQQTRLESDEKYRGRSLADCLILIEEELGRPLPEGFLNTLNERTFQAFNGRVQAIPGVKNAILRIQEKCVKICVASSGSHEKMRLTLGMTGLLSFFENSRYSASEVAAGKPAPDLFLHAAAQMNVPIEQTAIVEDSLPGIRAGLASGARVLAFGPDSVGSGSGHHRYLSNLGAEPFDSMTRLPELLF